MFTKKRVLLKLTGTLLSSPNGCGFNTKLVKNLATQIKTLKESYDFALVIGGGNIFRGEQQAKALELSPATGHQIGMIATILNGLLVRDVFEQQGIYTSLFSSISCPQLCDPISQSNIDAALEKNNTIIFVGGTGAPFFTTDTNAVVRALQIGAPEVWKGSDIDSIYTADPAKNKNATPIKKINYSDAISQKLGILDTTALTLAQKHKIIIRVFTIFEENALLKADKDKQFGSTIS